MLQAIATLLTVELIGLAAYPVVARAFPVLADRGWAISKPVGMLLISTVIWLASYTQLIPNSPITWWVVFGLLAFSSVRILRSDYQSLKQTLVRRWRIILTIELIFILFFVMFLSMRAFDPAASGTEKPMDLMMLTAVASAEHAPPQDLWLAGEPIAYYYFGYWIYGGVNAMAGTIPAVAFNVGIALVAGLSASIAASFVVTLGRRDGIQTKTSLLAGGASAVLLLITSNLSGLWTLLDITKAAPAGLLNWYRGAEYDRVDRIVTWRPDDFWWWWKSSRITNTFSDTGDELDFTIQEFPFFSILLGDFHPHLMSIPFVLTGVTVLVALFIARRSISFESLQKNVLGGLIVAVVVGASGFINFWDLGLLLLLSAGLVIAGWITTRQSGVKSLIRAGLPLAILWGIGILIFSPFYFGTAESQVQWPPLAPVKYGTRPIHLISIWVLLLGLAVPTIVFLTHRYVGVVVRMVRGTSTQRESDVHLMWRPAWITAMILTITPWTIWAVAHLAFNENAQIVDLFIRIPTTGVLGVISTLGIAVVLTRARRGTDDGAQFVLILGTLALYLIFAAELFFVHDLFGNRMNTVFKFYYQAWIVLSVVAGYGTIVWQKHHPSLRGRNLWMSRTAIGLLAVVVISSIYFPVAAAVSKTTASGLGPELNSLSFLERHDPDELNVITDITSIATKDDVLVEAVGGSYTDFGRISEGSGVPTIIGWVFHETQWHGSDDLFADREDDVRDIYTTDDSDELQRLIAKYDLTMVVVGPRETSTYGNIKLGMFDTLGDRVIEHGKYTVFSIDN
jgi:YYY domain-containing protein